jgi:hypothetical protein
MVRLITDGAELQTATTVAADASPDGYGAGTVAPTIDTGTYRGGKAAQKCAGTATATSYWIWAFTAPAAGTTLYARRYLRVDVLPTTTKRVALFGTTALISVRLTSAGKLQLWNDTGTPAQIGADSALTVATGTWYRVQAALRIGTGATDYAELRACEDLPGAIDEVVASVTNVSLSDTQPVQAQWGWIDAPGATANLWLDDGALNDSSGTAGQQNTWPDDGRVVFLPVALGISASGLWNTCTNSSTTANLAAAMSRVPPLAHADSTTDTVHHQAHCVTSGASTQEIIGECQSPGAAGIPGHVFFDTTAGEATTQFGLGTQVQVAQSFQMAGALTQLDARLKAVGSPTDSVTVSLQTDNAGKPSGTILDSTTIPAASLSATFAWYSWVLAAPQALVVGARYWLVFGRSGSLDATNYYHTSRLGDSYGDGGWSTSNGSVWGAYTVNEVFRFRAHNAVGVAPITLLHGLLLHGEGVATGTKTGTFEVQLNPTIAATSFNYGNDVGAAGAYPTNWRWVKTALAYSPALVGRGLTSRIRTTKTDTGTRAAIASTAGVMLEYRDTGSGWAQYKKTADNSLWWGKQAATSTTGYYDNAGAETAMACQAGDWFLTTDPLPAEGVMLTSLATETDANIKANYTPV